MVGELGKVRDQGDVAENQHDYFISKSNEITQTWKVYGTSTVGSFKGRRPLVVVMYTAAKGRNRLFDLWGRVFLVENVFEDVGVAV